MSQGAVVHGAGVRRQRVERRQLPPALARWARPLLLATAVVATIAALAVWVFPTRTWLDQRAALAEVETELHELRAERAALRQRVEELDTDEQIERIARSQYGLVMPGEEAYAVLPAPEKPIELPEIWPFGAPIPPAGDAAAARG